MAGMMLVYRPLHLAAHTRIVKVFADFENLLIIRACFFPIHGILR